MAERCPHSKVAKKQDHGSIMCDIKKCKVKIKDGKCIEDSCSRKRK